MSATLTDPIGEVLRIPDKPRVQGPLLTRRIRRTTGIYLVVFVLALLPVLLDASPAWRAFGLGLVAPGGGFVFTSDPVFLILTLAASAYGFFVLFLRANHALLPAIWLAAAIGATLRVHTGLWTWAEWAVPLASVTFLVAVATRGRVEHRQARRRGAVRNRYLAERRVVAPTSPGPGAGGELTPDQLASQRFLFDRALQPVDEWVGFDVLNQYLMGAFRYQCNFAMWALALGQYTYTPAFHGYVNLAQRNLIEKMTERKVWEFWRHENLLGNLDPNPDPIRRDNIMYSGYYSLMLELYASNTGDRRYEREGSLPLRWNDRHTFSYDASSIADAVQRNFERSNDWAMFPCEPGFVFPACNTLGLCALTVRDVRLGTHVAADLLPRFRRTLDDEFTTADGTIISNVFARYGFGNTLLSTLAADGFHGVLLHPLAPDITARTHEILRQEVFEIVDDQVVIRTGGLSTRMALSDPGNNAKGPLFLFTSLLTLARELGDTELAEVVERQAERECAPTEEGGARWFSKNSVFANAFWTFALLGRESGWRDLVSRGMPAGSSDAPALIGAAYPDVMVARATSDGRSLELVLYPGEGAGRRTLGIERLEPDREYQVTGATTRSVRADASGSAELLVDLEARSEVRLVPAD